MRQEGQPRSPCSCQPDPLKSKPSSGASHECCSPQGAPLAASAEGEDGVSQAPEALRKGSCRCLCVSVNLYICCHAVSWRQAEGDLACKCYAAPVLDPFISVWQGGPICKSRRPFTEVLGSSSLIAKLNLSSKGTVLELSFVGTCSLGL